MTALFRLVWTMVVLLLFFQPLFSQDAADIYRRRPCEVRPPAAEPKPPPAAEIEESSDRDPVPPQPRKPAAPRKGKPDDRRIVRAEPEKIQGDKKQVFDHFLGIARQEGKPHNFRWTAYDGEVSDLIANPNGTILIKQTNRKFRSPMPRQVVAAPRPFRAGEEYDSDHWCNRCGAEQLVVSGWNPDGTHSHVCSRCSHSWRHR